MNDTFITLVSVISHYMSIISVYDSVNRSERDALRVLLLANQRQFFNKFSFPLLTVSVLSFSVVVWLYGGMVV